MQYRDVPYRRWKPVKIYTSRHRSDWAKELVISKQAQKLITIMGKAIKSGMTVNFECRILSEDQQKKLGVYDVIDLEIRK